MTSLEYRKQLLKDRIASNRHLLGLEIEVLKGSNPLAPVLDGVQQVRGLLGLSGDGGRSFEGLQSASLLLLRILRLVLSRRTRPEAAQG